MTLRHPYLPTTPENEDEMLRSMGLKSLEDLFTNIPKQFRLNRDLNLPTPHSEHEVLARLQKLAKNNSTLLDTPSFLGGSVAPHYIPATVSSLGGRSEFVTAYTSYQPEISQGMLQTLFEYQSLMAEVLQMDVVNSSLYDLSTSLGEAARMVIRVKRRRNRFLVPGTINPTYKQVLETYTSPAGIKIDVIDYDSHTGLMSVEDLKSKLDSTVAGVYVESPSPLGFFETQLDEISSIVHDNDALLVAGVDVLSLGIMRPPGDYNADIAIAEGQSLGNPMSYGGPLLGVFACRNDRKLIYQMPGRLVGLTTTIEEPHERGFVLTLSAREQHIRRERATSNICSNQALMAVRAAIYLSTIGATGIRAIAESIAFKSNYAAKELGKIQGVTSPAIGGPIWKNFVVQFEGITAQEVHEGLLAQGIHGGKCLSKDFPDFGESMLFSVTELHDRATIGKMIAAVEAVITGGVA
ncbi:MAG: aminomethyl-transferring glycine dehydrogenase subunit GcvPA [Candidatus Thorarchaeota archaeon]|nr:aminomethyl-transferring glycine dehydrogenase subunit GcvPA [Candidatus Thorarchaeota archaeon]